jgi:hypothetical protein
MSDGSSLGSILLGSWRLAACCFMPEQMNGAVSIHPSLTPTEAWKSVSRHGS